MDQSRIEESRWKEIEHLIELGTFTMVLADTAMDKRFIPTGWVSARGKAGLVAKEMATPTHMGDEFLAPLCMMTTSRLVGLLASSFKLSKKSVGWSSPLLHCKEDGEVYLRQSELWLARERVEGRSGEVVWRMEPCVVRPQEGWASMGWACGRVASEVWVGKFQHHEAVVPQNGQQVDRRGAHG